MADNITKLPSQAGKNIGESGTLVFNGIITDKDYNRKLTGSSGYRIYEIMRKSDSTIHGILSIVKLPLRKTTWDITPPSQEDGTVLEEDKIKAAFIKRELMQRRVKFRQLINEALTMFDFGFSVFEKTFEMTEYEGKPVIGLASIDSRKQTTVWKWQTEDGKPGITQMVANGGQFSIPEGKLLRFTLDQEGDNYEGTSMLRYIYKDWDIKDKLTLTNAISLEKLGVGVPVISVRDGQTATAQDEIDATDALRNMRANESAYLKIPSTMKVEMLDLQGQTTKDIIPSLEYHDRRIMTSSLTTFLDFGGSSGSGSQSLSKDLTGMFYSSEEAIADQIVEIINDGIIKQLCDFNFSDNSSGYPTLSYGAIADDDNEIIAQALSTMASASLITPSISIEDKLRKQFRLPAMTQEEKDKYEERHAAPDVQPASNDTTKDELKNKEQLKKDVEASLDAIRNVRTNLIGSLAGA